MKITFSALELSYLDANLKVLNAFRLRKDAPFAGQIARLKGKFSPNCLVSFLTRKDRAFIMQLLNFRESELRARNEISDETALIISLKEKVQL